MQMSSTHFLFTVLEITETVMFGEVVSLRERLFVYNCEE